VSGVGASAWEVQDGDVDGWVWGDGSTAPPAVSFAQVCPADVSEPAEAATAPGPAESSPVVARTPSREPPEGTPGPTRDAGLAGQTPSHGDGGLLLQYGLFGAVVVGLVVWLTLFAVRARKASRLVR
jgi:hypothetical protein